MSDLLRLIQERRSSRVPFNPHHPVAKENLRQILEAARWAPTPHNMQNFEIIVVDDKEVLKRIGNIKSRVSVEFLRENYQQLSFSKAELLKKKVGILGTVFPRSWTDPAKLEEVARKSKPSALSRTVDGSPVLLIVIYDYRKRAPDSEGDFLGIISLGCVMENMWLMAQSLGISLRILSEFGESPIVEEVRRILDIPENMKIGYACRLGYPISSPARCLGVRRDVEEFTHHDMYGNRGID